MGTNFFKLVFKINRLLMRLESFLLITTLLVLMFFAFLQVFLRNVMDSGIHWADVFNRLLVLWIGFLGATLAAEEDKHLSLELLTKFLPDRYKPVIDLFIRFFVIVVAALLTHYSYLFFVDQITFESSDILFEGLPIPYFTIVFPVGFGLLCFRYFVKLLENVYVFSGGDRADLNPASLCPEVANVSIEINLKQSTVSN